MKEEEYEVPHYWELTPIELANIWGDAGFYREMPGKNPDGTQAITSLDEETRNYYLYLSLAKAIARIEEKLGTTPPRRNIETYIPSYD